MAARLLLRRVGRVPSLADAFKKSLLPLCYSNSSTIPTDQEQATGLEKKELDALMAGIDDPFNMKIEKVPGGTRDKPQLVPSMYSERLVGCICDEEAIAISWMSLKKGPPQRCDCGHWFQLTEGSAIKVDM